MTTAAASTAAAPLPRKSLVIFGVIALILMMSNMQGVIVAVAFPTLKKAFATNLALVGWVLTGYSLAQIIVGPLAGKLSDEFGRKRVFLTAVGIFTLATLACGLSTNIYMLLACRIVQGIGGGAIQPCATGIVSDAFGSRRATALGLFLTIFQFGAILGPNVGGVLIDQLSWRWVFLMNIPFGVAVLILAFFIFPRSAPIKLKQRIDVAGVLTYGLAIILFLFAVTDLAQHSDAHRKPLFWSCLAGAAVFLWVFIWRELRVASPIVNIRLLGNRQFAAYNISGFLFGVSIPTMVQLIPLNATLTYGWSPTLAGFVLTPRAIVMIITATIASFMLPRTGYRVPIVLGACIATLAWVLIGLGDHEPSFLGITLGSVVYYSVLTSLSGIANGLLFSSLGNAGLDLVPGDSVAAVAGLTSVFQNTGTTVATAVVIMVMSHSADQGAGLRLMYTVMAFIVPLAIAFTFLFPDMGRRGSKAALASASLATAAKST